MPSEPVQLATAVLRSEGISGRHNVDLIEELIASAWRAGYAAGLLAFAHWRDGVQYVGTCGTTLAQALEELKNKRPEVADAK